MAVQFDYSRLRGRIVERYGTLRAFVNELPIGSVAFTQKMKGRVAFKNDEIITMAEKLDIGKNEIPDYFFCLKR